jgi:hypothetical protein
MKVYEVLGKVTAVALVLAAVFVIIRPAGEPSITVSATLINMSDRTLHVVARAIPELHSQEPPQTPEVPRIVLSPRGAPGARAEVVLLRAESSTQSSRADYVFVAWYAHEDGRPWHAIILTADELSARKNTITYDVPRPNGP